jgi:hypothetical protein
MHALAAADQRGNGSALRRDPCSHGLLKHGYGSRHVTRGRKSRHELVRALHARPDAVLKSTGAFTRALGRRPCEAA